MFRLSCSQSLSPAQQAVQNTKCSGRNVSPPSAHTCNIRHTVKYQQWVVGFVSRQPSPACISNVAVCQAAAIPEFQAEPQESVKSFLESKGLASYQVDRLALDLHKKGDKYFNTRWLKQKFEQLEEVLPGEVGPLLYCDIGLLDVDAANVAQHLAELTAALPGVDVWEVVSKQPRLLYMSGAAEQVGHALNKLVQLYPYKSADKKGDVLKLVQEYPQLLCRMEYYMQAKQVGDLPVDLQNCILRTYC